MKYPTGAIIWFIGGSFNMIALIGGVVRSFAPHHPALALTILATMGFTALCYIMCGRSFSKWQQDRKTAKGIANLIEGAKNGWNDPDRVRGIATHPRTYTPSHDESGRTQLTSMGE